MSDECVIDLVAVDLSRISLADELSKEAARREAWESRRMERLLASAETGAETAGPSTVRYQPVYRGAKSSHPPPTEFQHDANPTIDGYTEIEYCTVCGFPRDFCEFGPCWERCRASTLAACPQYYSHLSKEEIDRLIETAVDAPASTTAAPVVGGKKKKAEDELKVTIKLEARKGKKTITKVTGLERFGVKLDKAAKALAKKFACGASVVKGVPGHPDSIEIQGDVAIELDEAFGKEFPEVPRDKVANLG
eukprot:GDKH01004479.1.p1 GENE.GDKH01004479.1~~GDKH01004479.1.p1  ORF type:complete len:250 (+),score=47.39 GDKH01004479.1:159-908(+)